MKTYQKLIPIAMLGLLLAGCGSKNSDNQNASMKNSESTSVKSSSDSSSSKASSSESSSSSSSASSSSDTSSSSANSASEMSNGVKTKNYSSNNSAQNKVGYQSASDTAGLPTVDLGSGIKGAKDGGAGQVFVSFNMGRWSIAVRGTDVNTSDTATPAAKQIVAYLQTHTLPVPNTVGRVMADIDSGVTTVKWQDGNAVHSVSRSTPEAALQAAIDAK